MNNTRNLLIAIALLIAGTVAALAAVPQTINYQGYLTASGGTPVHSPLGVPMVFSLYSSNPPRNNLVWQEPMKLVPVSNGIYSTQIGSVTPITAPFDVPYFLGVQVASDPEMPLQPLSSTGYAFRARMADTVIPGAANSGVTPWSSTASSSITAAANSGYMLTGSSTTTVTLPTNAAVGDVIRVYSQGTGGYDVLPGGGQVISGAESYKFNMRDSARSWQAVATSADGMKQVAAVANGLIYTSTNGGATWVSHGTTPRNWYAIASSSDGSKLVAVVNPGQIYTSDNSGGTWIARDSVRNWYAVTSSADGSKMAAIDYGGSAYTSNNGGVDWLPYGTPDWWRSLASSADGTKLIASSENGNVYTFDNNGLNWTLRGNFGGWVAVASSGDGTKLATAAFEGYIKISTDSGATWNSHGAPNTWLYIAFSADGNRLAATTEGSTLFLSADSGTTWTLANLNAGWTSVALSANGSRILLSSFSNYLYTGVLSVSGKQAGSAELIYLGNGTWGVNQTYGNFVAKSGDRMSGPLYLPIDGLNVGDGQLVAYNGSVGIGTLPAFGFALDVTGAGRFSGLLSLPADSLYLGGSQLVTSGGNVGIGTASPVNRLDVVGNAKITGSLTVGSLIVPPPMGNGATAATPAESCRSLKSAFPASASGTYWLDPDGGSTANAFQAYCNMTTSGGGWTLVSTLKRPFPASGIGETTGQVTTSTTAWMDQVRYRKLLAVSSEFMAGGDTNQVFATLNDGLSGNCQSLATPKPFYIFGTPLTFTYGFAADKCGTGFSYFSYAGIDLSSDTGSVVGFNSNNPIVSAIWRGGSSSGSYLTTSVTLSSNAVAGLFLYVR
jgi:hypothetical protein